MNKLLLIMLSLITILGMVACSEKDDNPTDVGVYGYKLDQFITKSVVTAHVDSTAADSTEFRGLYNYEIISGEDGFSPRLSSNAGYDLNWNAFKEGFLVPTAGNKTWFADTSLPHAFQVTETGLFKLYRKIDVLTAAKGTKSVELRGLPIYNITNWDGNAEDAIKLSDLLAGIAAYDSVQIVCYDGYGSDKYYHADDINDGYYLLNTETTIFVTSFLLNNMSKMKKVAYLNVIGATSAQVHDFELAPHDAADLTFNVPVSLDGYVQTELTDYPGK